MSQNMMKGKGKDKGKEKRPQGHTLPRTRVSAEKFAGTVTAWKGKYGWIQPAEEIEHEKAKQRNGSLFASQDDIEDGSTELHPGAPCEFHIWEDDTGLGAEEIVETGPPDPSAIPEPKGKGKDDKGGCKGAGGKSFGAAAKGYGKASSPVGGYGKVSAKGYGGTVRAAPWSEPYGGKGDKNGAWGAGGKGKDAWDGGNGKGKEKGKGKSKFGGKGHLLPRTRVSAEKFQGTVSGWKGKYGWITPAEEIEHEKAHKHGGKLFVSKDDLEGVTELTEGATVDFHVWEDESGLGAEEVVQY